MSSPLISIGLPAFNCEKTLEIAVRSILNQTYRNWELLLIEDGSSDRTLDVARSFCDPRISVFSDRDHMGLVACLNRAVGMSRGNYFARIDADDVAYPERLERQVEFLQRRPEVDLLGCGILVFKGDGVALGHRAVAETHQDICRHPTEGFCIGHPTWIGRTEWFRAHPYDAKAVRAEDQVLLLKAYETSVFACLPEILCGYREEELALGKILRGRYTFATAAIRECIRSSRFSNAVGVIFRQLGKTFLDTLASTTGLTYLVLPHRAHPLDSAKLSRWVTVWSGLQDESQSELPKSVLIEI